MREDKYCLVEETYNEKYESISLYEEFCKAILGKQFDSVEKVCEEFFSIKGINMRFLPLEEERTQASFVRNLNIPPAFFYIIPLFGKYENRKFINFALSQSAVPARDSSQESYQY